MNARVFVVKGKGQIRIEANVPKKTQVIQKIFLFESFLAASRDVAFKDSREKILIYNLFSCKSGPYCGYEQNERSEKNQCSKIGVI